MSTVTIKWGKEKFPYEIDTSGTVAALKEGLKDRTGVPVGRQKLMARGAWKGTLKDDTDLSTVTLKQGQVVTLVGAADKLAARPTEEVKFVEDMTKAEVAAAGAVVPAGLVNEGNTCYMNSTLECIRYIPEIRDALKDWDGTGGGDGAVTLASELKNLYDSLDSSVEAVRPLRFVQRLRTMYPQFAEVGARGIYKQQDAEELQNNILQVLSSALRKPTKHVPELGSESNALDATLGFPVQVTMSCAETDDEAPKVAYESQRKLICNIEGGAGAKTQVNDLMQGIKLGLTGTLEKHSEALGRNATWKVERRIDRLPRVFAIQFMRFYWKATPDSMDHAGVKCKMMRPVSFPAQDLDLLDVCTERIQAKLRAVRVAAVEEEEKILKGEVPAKKDTPEGDADMEGDDDLAAALALSMGEGGGSGGGKEEEEGVMSGPVGLGLPEYFRGKYELAAVVTHKGRSADSGHYIGFVRKSGDDWLCFDDDEVSPCKTEHVMKLKGGGDHDMAYLAFYRAQTQTVAEEMEDRRLRAEAAKAAKK